MKKETFIRGIQLINSVMSESHQIKGSSFDTYFLVFGEYGDQEYINAIMNILKKENLTYGAPSPATIIKYIEKESKSNEKALEIFERIKIDILLYGSNQPKYKKEIKDAINSIGGWNKLRNATEKEMEKIEKEFISELDYNKNSIGEISNPKLKAIKEK